MHCSWALLVQPADLDIPMPKTSNVANMMDQCQIYGDVSLQTQIASMEARQQEFNTRVNLLMPSKVWYLHHV
jgi:hypothetical protein